MKSVKVKISELKPDKEQPRKIIEGISELAESLKEKGQLSPIIITSNFTILDGHRRYLACKKAGIEFLDAVILDDKKKLTPFLRRAYPFAINVERHGFKLFDMAESICHIYWNYFLEEYTPKTRNDNGYGEFSRSMGISKTQVNDIINTYSTAKKSGSLAAALKKKDVVFSTLKEIAKAPQEHHSHYIEMVRKEQKKPLSNRSHLRDMIRDEKSRVFLESKEELTRSYLVRIKINSNDLASLLNPAVIKLADDDQIKSIKKSLKPIVNFNTKLE